jgi:transcriptional regulator GlxA family with amidase domain
MHRIGFVVSPGFQVMGLAAMAAFEFANITTDSKVYDVTVLSQGGGAVPSSLGVSAETSPFGEAFYETVIFAGGLDSSFVVREAVDFARQQMSSARRVASVCTGAFVLAEAGVLDGRRATTHWANAQELQLRFPKIRVEQDRIFIVDGQVWTSAGATAGVDLALGMIEKDLGVDVARATAKKLVVYHRRVGGQSQHSALLDMDAKSDRIQLALDYARQNLNRSLGVTDLAQAAHLSPRQFSRAFRAETGVSPAKAIEKLRVEAARNMLEQTMHSIDTIAVQVGFADRDRMRRAFLRAFALPPQAIRRSVQAA